MQINNIRVSVGYLIARPKHTIFTKSQFDISDHRRRFRNYRFKVITVWTFSLDHTVLVSKLNEKWFQLNNVQPDLNWNLHTEFQNEKQILQSKWYKNVENVVLFLTAKHLLAMCWTAVWSDCSLALSPSHLDMAGTTALACLCWLQQLIACLAGNLWQCQWRCP